ncbi:hypothetical protein ACGFXB_33735 [Streptomyces canus]
MRSVSTVDRAHGLAVGLLLLAAPRPIAADGGQLLRRAPLLR